MKQDGELFGAKAARENPPSAFPQMIITKKLYTPSCVIRGIRRGILTFAAQPG